MRKYLRDIDDQPSIKLLIAGDISSHFKTIECIGNYESSFDIKR